MDRPGIGLKSERLFEKSMESWPFGVSILSDISITVSAKAPYSFFENDILICFRESAPSGSSLSGNGLKARMWIPVEVGQYSLAWGQGQPSGQFLLHGQRSEQWANSRLQPEVHEASLLHSFEHSSMNPWQSSTHWSFSRKKIESKFARVIPNGLESEPSGMSKKYLPHCYKFWVRLYLIPDRYNTTIS